MFEIALGLFVAAVIAFIVWTMVTAGTKTDGERVEANGGDFDYHVRKLFTTDGCTVYRFYDSNYVYFTNCPGSTQHQVSCGKNCWRPEKVDTK